MPFGATVTIFFSDIRGFTEYTNQHGDEAAWRMLRQHNALVNKQIELFGGRVVKTQGDSFMVYFPTARAAIRCAVAIQHNMASEAQNEPGARIQLGIGINTGEPIQEDGDFFGTTVNLAARICAAAAPGQILVSETSRYVAGRLEAVDFVDRGLREVKGFPEPQHLYEARWVESRARQTHRDSRDLRGQIAALRERFKTLGADLLEASRAMRDAGKPPADFPSRLIALRADFVELRDRLLQRAGVAGVRVAAAPETLLSLGALEPVLNAIAEAETANVTADRDIESSEDVRSRQAALETAVQRAIGVLSRVLTIRHHDDPTFEPLLESQAKASELRLTLSRLITQNPGYGADRVDEVMLPFADLVALVADREHLDDDRFAQLEAAVRRSFGRPLAVAAARGRLYIEGQETRRPQEGTVPAPVEAAGRRLAPAASATTSAAAPVSESASPVLPAVTTTPVVDPRLATVRWWAEASAAWAAWRGTGLAFAHAARAELARHPHLLGIPLQASCEAPGGSVAASFFLLLEHLDRSVPGAMRGLADRALASASMEPLGACLYQGLIEELRLAENYPDFVRDIIVAVIPVPGVWADGGLIESEEATVVVRRMGGLVGAAEEHELRLTEAKDRYVERHFPLTVGPLTTRFISLRGVDLKEPRDVHVKLIEEGEASAQAWLLVQHIGYVGPPLRQRVQGTDLPGLGRNYGGVWIAVFNGAIDAQASFEVVIGIQPQSQLAARRFAQTGRDAR